MYTIGPINYGPPVIVWYRYHVTVFPGNAGRRGFLLSSSRISSVSLTIHYSQYTREEEIKYLVSDRRLSCVKTPLVNTPPLKSGGDIFNLSINSNH